MNSEVMSAAGLGDYVDKVKLGKCPFCGKDTKANDFRDVLSLREFKISGLCQKCQDETFGA